MVNDDGDINISTKKEIGYKVIKSYKLKDINNVTVWNKINRLIVELNNHHDDELLKIYIFTKTFKDHLIPTMSCSLM